MSAKGCCAVRRRAILILLLVIVGGKSLLVMNLRHWRKNLYVGSVVNKNTCLQVVQHYFASLAIPFKKKHFFLNGIDVFV